MRLGTFSVLGQGLCTTFVLDLCSCRLVRVSYYQYAKYQRFDRSSMVKTKVPSLPLITSMSFLRNMQIHETGCDDQEEFSRNRCAKPCAHDNWNESSKQQPAAFGIYRHLPRSRQKTPDLQKASFEWIRN